MSDPAVMPEELRGVLSRDVPLGTQSWFRCGGSADSVYEPADEQDLLLYLQQCDRESLVLGGMANCIIRDGGIRQPVIRFGKAFADIRVEGNRVIAGAGALNGSVASAAAKAGIGGLEFLSGIPGTVGGAMRMNAGAYGTEIKDVLLEVDAIMPTMLADDPISFPGLELCKIKCGEMKHSYRHCGLDAGAVFTGAVFEGRVEERDIVRTRLKEIKEQRRTTQPITEYTGGSTFANPSVEELAAANLPKGTRAWQLVERVGGRGLRIGGAQMSEKHCNFMLNTGDATAGDLEALGDNLIRRVYEETGLTLRWEIKRIGH